MFLIDPYRNEGGAPPITGTPVTLLHFDGADGSTTITCEVGLPYTRAGNAQLSTAQQKFGPSSMALDGSGDRIISDTTADLRLNNSDWTMELFFRLSSYVTSTPHVWQIGSSGSERLLLYVANHLVTESPTDNLILRIITGGAPLTGIDTGLRPIVGRWYHAATVRKDGDIRQFIDGVGLGTLESSFVPSSTSPSLCLGWQHFSGLTRDYFPGWIDEARFVRGQAIYWDDFSPPVAPFVYP